MFQFTIVTLQAKIMIQRILLYFISITVLASCSDESKRIAEIERDQKKKEEMYSTIQKAWQFNAQPLNATSQSLVSDWTEWRELLSELNQKPQSSIGAFRKKSKTLSQKVELLRRKVPVKYSKPQIRSRISVLETKINSLDLYMNLDAIPSDKVITSINDINSELRSLQMQLDEIVRRERVPVEEGESDMIRMLDTTRAIPTMRPELIEPQ